jgi:metal-sulfur cluster biosynthetic enzyme
MASDGRYAGQAQRCAAILDRLAQVLDPELDEPILDLGFVRSLELVPVTPGSRCDCRRVGAR